jgi:hypothetical protein
MSSTSAAPGIGEPTDKTLPDTIPLRELTKTSALELIQPAAFIENAQPHSGKEFHMIAEELGPQRRDKEGKTMKFFHSKQDKSLLLVMDKATGSGHVFKVAAETWTLVWSGIVTEDFLSNPAWKWETTQKDPATFPGGWPKPN